MSGGAPEWNFGYKLFPKLEKQNHQYLPSAVARAMREAYPQHPLRTAGGVGAASSAMLLCCLPGEGRGSDRGVRAVASL